MAKKYKKIEKKRRQNTRECRACARARARFSPKGAHFRGRFFGAFSALFFAKKVQNETRPGRPGRPEFQGLLDFNRARDFKNFGGPARARPVGSPALDRPGTRALDRPVAHARPPGRPAGISGTT